MVKAAEKRTKTANNGPRGMPKAAYISAPASVDTSSIRSILEGRGVRCFSPDELDLSDQNLSRIVQKGMKQADLVVGVIDPTPASSFVFYELGFAQAMKKPTVVFLRGDVPSSTWLSSGVPYFRFEPENLAALEFGLTQVLSVPHHGDESTPTPSRRTQPIGDLASELLAQLDVHGDNLQEAELEAIISQAIRQSGVRTVSKGGEKKDHIALAVWADDFAPWVGNPLLIEFRRTLRNAREVNDAVQSLARSISGDSLLWGLLIYMWSEVDVSKPLTVPNILCISAKQFLEALRVQSFGELIRGLRNQRVHGLGS